MRRNEEFEETCNCSVYNKISKDKTLKCSRCKPHRGCNRHPDYYKNHLSWKNFRKDQWK